ncbi:hypothetical protein B0H16DRAFT_1460154 [Mycena metata]|uniref:Uncharacterized protein n=1 Tax=Mycena metata TaxID=1033252 RepID=A0AAD7N9N4_9AGAR|nr:hypothetical protein B0H16DRAFT_1460154 [Mycena metata]
MEMSGSIWAKTPTDFQWFPSHSAGTSWGWVDDFGALSSGFRRKSVPKVRGNGPGDPVGLRRNPWRTSSITMCQRPPLATVGQRYPTVSVNELSSGGYITPLLSLLRVGIHALRPKESVAQAVVAGTLLSPHIGPLAVVLFGKELHVQHFLRNYPWTMSWVSNWVTGWGILPPNVIGIAEVNIDY